ncbi:FHA domain-containing protein [Leptolyngbya sp. PCC 6406]|uniref:FHA domain-containing protein n=1 Tax=Leptolyngbya sp. PCC 6406 TaxID=1173264 RepID=UPI0002AC49E8|nr:FHA domain-containing protein [Leptolyngbya sp. PCC 6406]
MIVCPNCNHPNPDGAVQCEACYTPLPTLESCPGCGAPVQSDASFCGQCGFDLRSAAPTPDKAGDDTLGGEEYAVSTPEIPPLSPPDPLIAPEPIAPEPISGPPVGSLPEESSEAETSPLATIPASSPPLAATSAVAPLSPPAPRVSGDAVGATQIQVNQAKLMHVQTNSLIELSPQLALIRIGKPNDRFPPDIDVAGFPNSEIVSRAHAQLRVEGDVYYIEDVGSSNGTYVNNMPLPYGNRHRLRPGDRIGLGKGDKVTFIFQSP